MDLVLGCRLGIVWRSLEPVIACLFLSSQQVSHFGARLHEPNSIQYSLLVIKTKTVDHLPIKNGGLPWCSICLQRVLWNYQRVNGSKLQWRHFSHCQTTVNGPSLLWDQLTSESTTEPLETSRIIPPFEPSPGGSRVETAWWSHFRKFEPKAKVANASQRPPR